MAALIVPNILTPAPSPFAGFRRRLLVILLSVGMTLMIRATARADGPTVVTSLHSFFYSDQRGYDPECALLPGGDGYFYGTTVYGGAHGSGTVYRIAPSGDFQLLHEFGGPVPSGSTADGFQPSTTLVRGSDGAFYGTTVYGGQSNGGTVYRITADGAFSNLHSFVFYSGPGQTTGLVVGSDGNLYGTTPRGGPYDLGTIYRVTPSGVFTLLFNFTTDGGCTPAVGLVRGSDGTLYGTTSANGAYGYGTFFRLNAKGVPTVLHSFTSDEKFVPFSLMSVGQDGDFYGAGFADSSDYGGIFRLNTAGQPTILHRFTDANEGKYPYGPLLQLGDGNFYGVTRAGGGGGTLFRISASGDFANLNYFRSAGNAASSALVMDGNGSLYSTSATGGGNRQGEIFKLFVHPDFFNGQAAVTGGIYFLPIPGGHYFGYYGFLDDPHFLYHFDLGYEYVYDAADGHSGVYLYDFKSGDFFYTSPTFPFPYLYDFNLQAFLYYYPDPKNAGHYNTDGVRYFYNFATRETITR